MYRILYILFLLLLFDSCIRMEEVYVPLHAPFLQEDASWADSVLVEMTLEEKIGQLFVWAPENGLASSRDTLLDRIANGQLGGLLLNDLPIDSFLAIIDSSHRLADLPLLIGSEESIMLNNQFTDVIPFPLPVTLSSCSNDSLFERLEDIYAEHCQALGINFCFAPSLNRNRPSDSLFHFSTLINDQEELLWQSTRLMNKLQQRNILSFAGEFKDLLYLPGDTTQVLDSILHPFFNLSINGLSGILSHPTVFEKDTSMFKPMDFLRNYGKQNLDFGGLLLAKVQSVSDIEEQFLAGVDVFLIKDSLEENTSKLIELVENGFLSERMLNTKVYQILRAKYWVDRGPELDYGKQEEVIAALKDPNQKFWIQDIYESSIVLAQNPKDLLPLKDIYRKSFRIAQISEERHNTFLEQFEYYSSQTNYHLPPFSKDSIAPLNPKLFKNRNGIIVLGELQLDATLHKDFIKSVNHIAQNSDVVLVNYGNPFNLQFFDTTMALLQVFERTPLTESLTAQVIFGGRVPSGKLPVAVSERLPYGTTLTTETTRLAYGLPEEVGIAAYKLVGIDVIAKSAIAKKTTPGCQVMVIKNGKVIYDKNFGYQSVHKDYRVRSTDLYDIASITKVATTTLSMMKLYEEEKVKVTDRLEKHLELDKKSPIKRLTMKQILTHQSGLRSYMPINPYVMARDSNSRDCSQYFCFEKRDPFTIKVADSLFMDYHYVDTIWQDVYQIKPKRRKRFLYSDLNFALVAKVIESKTKRSLDDYASKNFYTPLNLRHTTFRPLEKFEAAQIIPTAHDAKWRKQVLRGYVHDESAALLNGVAGNAGLFSNARDMGVLFQMLLNKGTYGGRQYFKPETVDYFTKKQYKTHRGLGFDKRNKGKTQACSPKASSKTFGHTGFTGTCVWVDPDEDLIFIFLANRINESTRNKKIFREKVRRRMHTVVYKALDTYDPYALPEVEAIPPPEQPIEAEEAKAEL